MSLGALIFAYQDDEDGQLRSTLMLAGQSLIERQVHHAVRAGADRIVVMVERLPALLIAALDRLKAARVAVTVARTPDEAVDALGMADRFLVIADGLAVEPGQVARLAQAPAPAVLTVADRGDDRFERIDADCRWAGLALADPALLGDTVADLGEWDLQSTLLRRLLQAGARLVPLREEDGTLALASSLADLSAIEREMVVKGDRPTTDWASRILLAPLESVAARWLMDRPVAPDWLRLGGMLLAGLSVPLFATGWLWPGGVLMLLALPLDGIARRLDAFALRPLAHSGWMTGAQPAIAGAALLALGSAQARITGWGTALLALVTILFLVAERLERGGRSLAGQDWLAERKGMTLVMLPFAIAGMWSSGLAILALYACASFFWTQRQVQRPTPPKD